MRCCQYSTGNRLVQGQPCRSDFRVETDDFDTIDTFSCKPLFILHSSVIVVNAVSGCYFPLVSCNTRVKHVFMATLLVITLVRCLLSRIQD